MRSAQLFCAMSDPSVGSSSLLKNIDTVTVATSAFGSV